MAYRRELPASVHPFKKITVISRASVRVLADEHTRARGRLGSSRQHVHTRRYLCRRCMRRTAGSDVSGHVGRGRWLAIVHYRGVFRGHSPAGFPSVTLVARITASDTRRIADAQLATSGATKFGRDREGNLLSPILGTSRDRGAIRPAADRTFTNATETRGSTLGDSRVGVSAHS
jgi:hypothetical protein